MSDHKHKWIIYGSHSDGCHAYCEVKGCDEILEHDELERLINSFDRYHLRISKIFKKRRDKMSVVFIQEIDAEVGFDVWCAECNEPLCPNMRNRGKLGSSDFLMTPCETCIENAREEGVEEGTSEGLEMGYEEGIVEGRETGRREGEGVGFDEGYTEGYQEGYEDAVADKART